LKEVTGTVGALKVALMSLGKPGQASAATMQCLAESGLYYVLQVTPHTWPRWQIVMNAIFKSHQQSLICMILTNADLMYAGRLDDKEGCDTIVTMKRVREAIDFKAELADK